MKISQRIPVSFTYDIHFTRGLFNRGNTLLASLFDKRPARVAVFIDARVARSWPALAGKIAQCLAPRSKTARLAFPPAIIPGGERCKTDLRQVEHILRRIRASGLDRHSYVMIIGGGAVLDAVGFSAAITHRGIRQIRVPTTVLAQCDSGVGVKTGINYGSRKNYYGTFSPPCAVVNDFDFLSTLDNRSWRSGIAEAFKVALIKDRGFFDFLSAHAHALNQRDEAAMEELIIRSATLHANHIAECGDPFETGSARPLDFGHWSAHALESMSGYTVGHGEAVAIGMAIDLCIAQQRGMLSAPDCGRVFTGLEACGFSLWHSALQAKGRTGKLLLYKGLEDFRLHMGGKLTVILPRSIGQLEETNHISYPEVRAAVQLLKKRGGTRT